MKKIIFLLFAGMSIGLTKANVVDPVKTKKNNSADNAGLTLPSGFVATKIADGLGSTRHIAISPKGKIYTKINYNKRSKYQNGILLLKDLNGDGIYDTAFAFGNFF